MKNVIKNKILLTLIEKGFEITLSKSGIILDGFYKSGTVKLEPKEDGTFIAHTRYNQTDDIGDFDDLVKLNYEWWQKSKDRSEHWLEPEADWKNEMIRLQLL